MAELEKLPGIFNLTAVGPHNLDYKTQYPVLAIRTLYTFMGQSRFTGKSSKSRIDHSLFDTKQIYAKDAYFLTADLDGNFRWVSAQKSSLFKNAVSEVLPLEGHKRLTRYSIEEDTGEDTNMIYPVRPFSITGVDLEGFDSGKEYPVLAIDMDRYLPEEQDDEENSEGTQSETMAFFLVGDDNGEFTWVGEDECKLYPL